MALSADRQITFVANVGMYAYPLIDGITMNNYNSMLISRHPYGNNTKESIEGTVIDGKKYPVLAAPMHRQP